MLHSAHANKTDQKRTVITLWYYPRFYEFPEGMRARLANKHPKLENWSEEAQKKIEPLNPVYEGDCDELEWSRIPGPELV